MGDFNVTEGDKLLDAEEFLGCFGVRMEELITIIDSYDLEKMNISPEQMRDVESLMARFVHSTGQIMRRSMEMRMKDFTIEGSELRKRFGDKLHGLATQSMNSKKIAEKMEEVLGKMGVSVKMVNLGEIDGSEDPPEDESDDTVIEVDKHQSYAFVNGKSTILFAYSPKDIVIVSESAAHIVSSLVDDLHTYIDRMVLKVSDGTNTSEIVFDQAVEIYGNDASERLILLPKSWFDSCGLAHGDLNEWTISVL